MKQLLAAQRILGHPFGEELKWITLVIIKVISSSLYSSLPENTFQFILLPHHASIDSTSNKLATHKELGKGLAIGQLLQCRTVFVAHIILGIFK